MRIIGNAILFVVAFCLRLAAPIAAVISMAAPGNFINKVIEGFQSLPEAIRNIIWWIKRIPEIGIIIEDYNTLTAATFNRKYGSGTVNYVMDYLNDGVAYLRQVVNNLSEQPIPTILAAVLVFLVFYLLARTARFVRQEGQGSVVTKFERRTGNRVFKKNENEWDNENQWG
jgi:predicted PurR-regulated permease PerM